MLLVKINPKNTPLFENHKKLGANVVKFGSWFMPVQYTGIIEEHNQTKAGVGLFDTCHMGEINISGSGAAQTLQWLIPRDVTKFKVNRCYYSHLCNEQGGIIDDIIVYKKSGDSFLLVVNSETYTKDYEWICSHKQGETFVEDLSLKTGKIDVQGPNSAKLMNCFLHGQGMGSGCLEKNQGKFQNIAKGDFSRIEREKYSFDFFDWQGLEIIVSRTGYTGLLGFEIYCPWDKTKTVWESLLELGKPFGTVPVGLGARDTLRLEAGYPLMGQDLTEEITPVEAGFEKLVDFNKQDFIGKNAIQERMKSNNRKYKISFVIDKGPVARHGVEIYCDDQPAGYVTSGTFSPVLGKPIGIALCDKDFVKGQELMFKVRGRFVQGKHFPTFPH